MSFIDDVRPLIMEAGASTSCWLRNRDHNAAVGGSEGSWHLSGLAVDVTRFPNQRLRDIFIDKCKRMDWGVLDEQDHVHVQAKPLRSTT